MGNRRGVWVALAGMVVALTIVTGRAGSGDQAQAIEFVRPGPVTQAILIAEYDEAVGDGPLLRFLEGDPNFELLRDYDNLPLVSIAQLADIGTELTIRQLLDIEGVVNVTEDVPVTTLLDTSVPHIGARAAQDLGFDGAGTTIAVMDTGISTFNPFIDEERLIDEACFSTPNGADRESLCPDGSTTQLGPGSASSETAACYEDGDHICDHGPHVTGIAAGAGFNFALGPDSGVAPAADIVAYQVFYRDNDPEVCDSDWPENPDPDKTPCVRSAGTDRLAAIDHLLDLIDDGLDVVALNVSIGGGEFEAFCSQQPEEVAYAALRDRGVIPVVAAGNNGFGQAVTRPACTPSAMRIGNTLTNDDIRFSSNRGELLDVFAPGTGINSSIGLTGFGNKTGTSMAAPHVAGALALLAQAHPDLPTEVLEAALIDSGVPITYTSGPGVFEDDGATWTTEVTTPRIDVRRALLLLEEAEPLAVTADSTEVVVDEGDLATTSGTVSGGLGPVELTTSYGTVEAQGDTWQWQHRTVDGPPESRQITVTATDALGFVEQVSFDLVVDNVAPTIVFGDSAWDRPFIGNLTTLDVTFVDPGIRDFDSGPFTIEVDCDAARAGTGVADEDVGLAGTEVLGTFGNNQVVEGRDAGVCRTDLTDLEPPFTVQVTVTDKDGDTATATRQVRWFDLREGQIRRIDVESPIAQWLEARTIIQQAERELLLDLDVFGPPGVDLDLEWRWGDGTSLDVDHPLGRDEDLTPETAREFTRGVRSTGAHTWRDPGLYRVELEVRGGDEVLPPNELTIAITGTETTPRDTDAWAQWAEEDDPLARTTTGATTATTYDSWQVRLAADGTISAAQLAGDERATYLELLAHLSPATDTVPDRDQLLAVLGSDAGDDHPAALAAQLTAGWLNVASGAVHLDAEVVTEDHTGSVESLLLDAEALLARDSVPAPTIRAVTAALRQLNTDGAQRAEEDGTDADQPGDDAATGEEDAPTFRDVDPDGVHAPAISWLVASGITEGFDDGTFRPGASVTRQQMASFLTRALRYGFPDEVARFEDVDVTNVHRDAITALAAEGVTEGCTPERFCPGDPVLRGQMASFLTRALAYPVPEQPPIFADVPPPNVHRTAIGALAVQGVTQGCGPDLFCPGDPVTRGQMATFLFRALAEDDGSAL